MDSSRLSPKAISTGGADGLRLATAPLPQRRRKRRVLRLRRRGRQGPLFIISAALDRLRADLQKALAEPDMLEKFTAFGYEPFNLQGPAFSKFIAEESRVMAEVIRNTRSSLD